jgi:hypothetical protein
VTAISHLAEPRQSRQDSASVAPALEVGDAGVIVKGDLAGGQEIAMLHLRIVDARRPP